MMRVPWKRSKTVAPTQEVPVKQDTPATTTNDTTTTVINVVGLTGNENWVYSTQAPCYPMPRKETVTLESLPEKNCAIPAGWFFPDELGSDEELVVKFPEECRELLCIAYDTPAIDIQYITFKYERTTGTVFATAWGYDRPRNSSWQTVVLFDVVQLFHPYIALSGNTICMDAKLCNNGFLAKKIHGSILRTRAAYGQDYDTAVQSFDILMDYAATIIGAASRQKFKHDFQIKADRYYAEVTASLEKLKEIIREAESLTHHAAVKSYYGTEVSAEEFGAVQALFDRFVSTTNELDSMGNAYYQLVDAVKMCDIELDLSKYDTAFDLVGTCIRKIYGLFEIMRG